jgi:ADP-ribosylglycohydrolase
MRVSPCGWGVPLCKFFGEGIEHVERLAEESAVITHNHPEGIKGAKAVAGAITSCATEKRTLKLTSIKNL